MLKAFEESCMLVDMHARLRAENEVRIQQLLESRPCGIIVEELRKNKRLGIAFDDIIADEEKFPSIESKDVVLKMAKVR